MKQAMVGVTACLRPRDHSNFHMAGDKYVDAIVLGADCVPVIIPAIAEAQRVDALLENLDGILVTGAPSNVDPGYYGGPRPRPDNEEDVARDATTLPLIRAALEQGVPLFAICRGIQELNVALGGSLHQYVHELPGRRDHRSDKTRSYPERYEPVHTIDLTRGGMLDRLLDGATRIDVNSLHGQGIDRIADRLVVEAVAEDGTIEAVSVRDAAAFALGVQWHPEWRVKSNPVSLRLFKAFGEAARQRRAARTGDERFRDVA